MNYLRTENKS